MKLFVFLVFVAALGVISLGGWIIACVLGIHYYEGWLLSGAFFYFCVGAERIVAPSPSGRRGRAK